MGEATTSDHAGTLRPPPARAPILGRDAELRALEASLADGVRLTTLTGLAGVGKTEIALGLLDRVRPLHEHAPVLAHLENVVDDEGALHAVAAAVALAPGVVGPVTARLEAASRQAPRVVVLDGCEQLAGVPHPVATLLEHCPGHRFVATSLRPLGLPDERVVGVDPLEVPPAWGGDRPLLDFPAVQLYCRQAHAAHATFEVSARDLFLIGGLCRAVHGLPLGIELLAARYGTLPPQLLIGHLDRVLDTEVERWQPGTPARHRSTSAALTWTCRLLDPGAAGLLELLAVFAGPAPIEMLGHALATLRADGTVPGGERSAFDLVSDLVDRRLAEADLRLEEPAFHVVAMVGAFAREQVEAAGRLAAIRRARDAAVLAYVAGRAESVERAADETSMLETAQAELDLRAALAHLTAAGDDDERALRLACGLAPFVIRPGLDGFVQPALEVLVARGERADPPASAGSGDGPALLTEAMLRLAHLRLATGSPVGLAATAALMKRGVDRARDAGDSRLLLVGLAATMQALPMTADVATASAAAVEALPLAESVGDPVWIARFCGWVGMISGQAGRLDEAYALAVRSLDQATRCGDPRSLLIAVMLAYGIPGERAAPLLARTPSIEEMVEMCVRMNEPVYHSLLLRVGAGHAMVVGDHRLAAARVVAGLDVGGAGPAWQVETTFGAVMLVVAADRGDEATAARLAGVVEPWHEQMRAGAPPAWFERFEVALDATRAALGDARFAEEAQVGREWSLSGTSLAQISRYARSVVAPLHRPLVAVPTVEEPLTSRERDVLAELASGASNKQIGIRLGVTPKTVMHHSVAIYRKLEVRGRAEATAWAFRHGMVS